MSDIKTVEDVRQYVQKDYWEDGIQKGVSGYKNTEINWWWCGRYAQMFNSAIDLRGRRILDLGCAYGEFVAAATLFGARIFGIDLSDYAIQAGKKKANWIETKIRQGSIHDLPYPNESFDFLHSHQVFEHLPGECCDQLATETFRVAQPGAVLWAGLVLDVSNQLKDGRNPDDPDKSHINIRHKDWWDEKFLRAGWVIEHETDQKLRNTLVKPDDFSFFKEYGWHTICYKKV